MSSEILRWTVDVGCTSHPGEYNGDQWPHSLVRTGASSPLLSSDHHHTVHSTIERAGPALSFLLHYTAAGISPDRQTPAPLAILTTKSSSFFIIMAVLGKFVRKSGACGTKTDTPLDIVLDPSITEMQKQSNIQLQRTDRALWLERLSVHWAAASCLHPHSFTALTITELTKLSGEQEDHLEN